MEERLTLTLKLKGAPNQEALPDQYVNVRSTLLPRRLLEAVQEKFGLAGPLEAVLADRPRPLREDLSLAEQAVPDKAVLTLRPRASLSRRTLVAAGYSYPIKGQVYLEDRLHSQYYPIEYQPAVIGRRGGDLPSGNRCQQLLAVSLGDRKVSRCHACIFEEGGTYYLQNLKWDAADYQPVYLDNEEIVARDGLVALKVGARIRLGHTTLTFNHGKAPGR
jgi:hypothetical protein